jgi:arylformamidase
LSADVDYEAEYNTAPGFRSIRNHGRLAARCEAIARRIRPSQGDPLRSGERNRIDLFSGDGAGAIVVFIHGSYWQALDWFVPSAISPPG